MHARTYAHTHIQKTKTTQKNKQTNKQNTKSKQQSKLNLNVKGEKRVIL